MDEQDQNDNHQQTSEISLDQLQQDFENAMNNWKRTAADFENYKKRKEAENKELIEFAREVTVAKLLPALDSLEQALKHMPEYSPSLTSPPAPLHEMERGEQVPSPRNGEGQGGVDEFGSKYANWQTGINGILLQLDKTLSEMGVKKIEAVGKKFDPHFHEAVREIESEKDDGTIVEELQSGFELNGKVIRPSQVVISKRKL